MTQILHHGSKAGQWDRRAQVDRTAGTQAGHRASSRTHGLPGLLRRHVVTILVLCALLAVATSLAM